ncbi:Co2+/Mg2+ efflux protein ApaG [Taibaiella sp. KBW10]|uniref:Co2+/Mg2+ efflux protein ApaG n=1 Tax=Taibaiella sp. KBW10 TaxID=2153357 RepID=UPI000F59AA35|nr:Co2+/Mg2+ efflux protein ApaG [Taibaiella sp. KBW10]RQO30431.1 Co2+/Mg2+ efflux protein ApaG [Taibaiella sp. KBW10]
MVKKITEGICVTVETFYQDEQSNPINGEYMFAYRITIDNYADVPVQLLRRNWHIVDSTLGLRVVEGEGVVGQTPIIDPNESFQYVSAANLRSDMGKMYGTYQMMNLYTQQKFEVVIPEFMLLAPFKGN